MAALHDRAPAMPAPALSTLTPTALYACGHPRCFLLSAVQLLLALSAEHGNAVALLRGGTLRQLLDMPAPAVYAALLDDVAALVALVLEHPWTVLQVRPPPSAVVAAAPAQPPLCSAPCALCMLPGAPQGAPSGAWQAACRAARGVCAGEHGAAGGGGDAHSRARERAT